MRRASFAARRKDGRLRCARTETAGERKREGGASRQIHRQGPDKAAEEAANRREAAAKSEALMPAAACCLDEDDSGMARREKAMGLCNIKFCRPRHEASERRD